MTELGEERSLLLVVPPAPDDASRVPSETVVAGLTLTTRLARAARAAGYADVLVSRPAPARVPRGRRRVVLVPANVVPQAAWLRAFRESPIEPETVYVDSASVMVVDTVRVDEVVGAAARASSVAALVSELGERFGGAKPAPDADGRFVLTSAADVPAAETWLLRSLIKHNEGFMSRHFERRISLAITRRLVRTPVTPNMVTMVSLAVGLAGAPFFVSAAAGVQLTGALIFLAHSILDGCDGEIARLKFLHSRAGAILDYWGDNAVHVAVFLCMSAGWAMATQTAWPLLLGVLASAGSLGSAAAMFEHTATDRRVGTESATATRLAAMLANRDFIYAIIALSAFGKAWWFLAVVAVGSPGFLAMVLWNERRHGRVR